jgi:hypothetical protein
MPATPQPTCPECGSTPMGAGCYHICSNSDHFYSPEQERYDDQFYGQDDVRERYAATAADADLCFAYPDEGEPEAASEFALAAPLPANVDPDDIPF